VVLLARETVPAAREFRTVGDLLKAEPGVAERFDGVDAHSTAIMCYSSGTTGLAKGVETTHHNLTSELQALNAGSRQLVSGVDVILGVLPFSHIYGLGMNFLQPAAKGCPVVVLPRFNEIPALEAIQKYKITHALIVPPIVVTLLNSKNVPNYDLTSLKTVVSGAAPLGGEIADAFAKLIPGVVMLQAYGNTETSPVVMTAHAHEFAETPGSVATCGKLLPTYQARVVDTDTGRDVGVGARGELWVRGPTIMKGYLNNPEATAKAVVRGGWYRTGDVVVVNAAGWYEVVDRVKELIKYKGFQVPPAELEALLLQHPEVVDAGVIGIYDKAQATELPRAYIVARERLDARREAALRTHVAEWVAGKVANHKKLRGGVVVVEAIPKSAAGKILRKELRALAEAEAPKAEARL
jgi:acyl-CoA synthetase (AMP-forming)/AMP-acid ligase II